MEFGAGLQDFKFPNRSKKQESVWVRVFIDRLLNSLIFEWTLVGNQFMWRRECRYVTTQLHSDIYRVWRYIRQTNRPIIRYVNGVWCELHWLFGCTFVLYLELKDMDSGPSAPSIKHDAVLEAPSSIRGGPVICAEVWVGVAVRR